MIALNFVCDLYRGLAMLRVELPQSRYATLLQADITDEEARTLIDERQQIDDILAIMVKAKLFSGSPEENKQLFMSLINRTKDMPYAGKPNTTADSDEDEFSDDLDELVSVYQMLGGTDIGPCVLTANAHHALLDRASISGTKKVLEKFISLDSLKQSTVGMYFSAPGDCMSLHCWTEIENPTGEWLLYALENIKSAKDIPSLVSQLRVSDGGELSFGGGYIDRKLWLTFETFKIMVQNADLCKNVMPYFLSYCAKMPKEPMVIEGYLATRLSCVFTLKKFGIPPNDDVLTLAFESPEIDKALSLCRDTGYIQENLSNENEQEYRSLLANKELIRAVGMWKMVEQKIAEEPTNIIPFRRTING